MKYIKILMVALLVSVNQAWAISIDKIYIYGDSASDGGGSVTSVLSAAKVFNPNLVNDECSFEGRLTNGHTAVEEAGAFVGLYSKATFSNFAISGFDSAQLKTLEAGGPVFINGVSYNIKSAASYGANNLVIIWIGGNDINTYIVGKNESIVTRNNLTVSNIDAVVKSMYNKGARKFLLVGTLNFSRVPAVLGSSKEVLVQSALTDFNDRLKLEASSLDALLKTKSTLASVKFYDAFTPSNWFFDASNNFANPSTLFDTSEQVSVKCSEVRAQVNLPSQKYYNWPIFDKDIFYDSLHFSRRAHLYFGFMLGQFLKSNY